MKRFYFIGVALVVVAAVFLHPPHTQTKTGLTLREAPPARHAARPAAAGVVVYVVGAVFHSGVYHLPGGARIQEAVAMAGGLTPQADPAGINLAELPTDGEEIAVPIRGEAISEPTHRTALHKKRTSHKRGHKRRKAPLGQPVDINRADASVLQTLPGVGPGLAQRLIDFRQVNGPFHTVDELADVAGMTDRRIEQITPYIRMH
ncbi:MAG: ComEA family DNA-binding protein [Candidatus Eremiobacteraeota bacterium]|nr:ComEA family DNA-binding protein [Candidatus Eremiobacteraeota bacterium]